ncbi:hypothetical protein CONPUDRAFT_161483 [Coniophora puteana RWD-64-598 SS2]|uniref:WW domain-containing protein n=1 Tax=Coniophora puteana (strain RWD-64-598) TaxID=741705 RepID=A0A5M3N6G0_CONPW|nr:uncharacterized protein CONPUDRAFT_161483 [Coniophora puteana RWD-64-598 SS2]EIW86848.1 hypothetical protein CONPUDRAFT_161483 [Coniophora puteana RWD-64-598 SS2]
MTSPNQKIPLPEGWVQEFDSNHDHPYWIDTKAKPPRAIWVHPYEDEQFLVEHPEIRNKLSKYGSSDLEAPPPYENARRHSFDGGSPSVSRSSTVLSGVKTPSAEDHPEGRKRGMFSRLKDKALGTKEEREAHKRQQAEERARAEEEYRQARVQNLRARAAAMQQIHQGRPIGGSAYAGYPGMSGSLGGPSRYGPPGGTPWANDGYPQSAYTRRAGFGGGGMALPLLGGLAGGLLLGDVLDGGFGGGGFDGGFGGGGFGGGFGGGLF